MHADGPTGPQGAGMTFARGASGAIGPGAPQLDLDECLRVVVEGYLFGDLDSMKNEVTMKEMGAVCYPMMMAVLAGSELLGALTGGRKDHEVEHYWKHWLSKVEPKYGELGRVAQDLLRNGLMHIYLTKPGIGVRRDKPKQHLREIAGALMFNCVVLADDFRRSYEEHAKAEIEAKRGRGQGRLNELMGDATKKSERILGDLHADVIVPLSPAEVAGGTIVTGASGVGR
jgi:hypothetical protein